MPNFDYLPKDILTSKVFLTASTMLTEITNSSHDGRNISFFTAGKEDKPTVLLACPVGISCLLLVKLIEFLHQDYFVITWESRGLPNYYADDRIEEWSPDSHAKDILTVVNALNRNVDHAISFCSGSYPLLYALANRYIHASSLCLISSPIELAELEDRTSYQEAFIPLLPRIAESGIGMAKLVRSLIKQGVRSSETGVEDTLLYINNLPFEKDEHTYRYALLHSRWINLSWQDVITKITIPTFIVHGEMDKTAHLSGAKMLAQNIKGAVLSIVNGHGHFLMYSEPSVLPNIQGFLNSVPGSFSK
ncbi:MAG: alpha/beta hydrolase [Exilibacterium sp.]